MGRSAAIALLLCFGATACGTPPRVEALPPTGGAESTAALTSAGSAYPVDPGFPELMVTSTATAPEPAPTSTAATATLDEAPVVPEAASEATRYPFHEPLPSRYLPKDAPAMRNANLSVGQCRRELTRRKLALKRQGSSARGIAEEYRVSGPISGVTFITPRAPSPYGLLDCRLGLALDDLAKVLLRHGVQKVRIDNFYRAGAKLPGRRHKKSQHSYGLAIDLVSFILEDGTVLSVEDDWGSGIGTAACGADATLQNPTERSVQLRNLACDIARAGIFHHMLTPGHDKAHGNHLHLDIKRGEKTTLIE